MLNKDICKQCSEFILNPFDNNQKVCKWNRTDLHIKSAYKAQDDNIPKLCPYKLEHVVMEQEKQEK